MSSGICRAHKILFMVISWIHVSLFYSFFLRKFPHLHTKVTDFSVCLLFLNLNLLCFIAFYLSSLIILIELKVSFIANSYRIRRKVNEFCVQQRHERLLLSLILCLFVASFSIYPDSRSMKVTELDQLLGRYLALVV